MISSDVIRGYNDTIILSILAKGPSYAYEISKTIRALSKAQYIIKETTLYSAMSRLEANGWIRPSEVVDRRTYYAITDAGIDYLQSNKTEWQTTQDVISQFI
jgi:PadR family transcriptional regulator PadR